MHVITETLDPWQTVAMLVGDNPLNTWRNNNVVITSKRRHFDVIVITSKWRRFDVITTSLLRHVSAKNLPLVGILVWHQEGTTWTDINQWWALPLILCAALGYSGKNFSADFCLHSCFYTILKFCLLFLAATNSSMNGSVRLSVRLSVRPSASVCLPVTPFWLCSHHRIIMKFSGDITNDKGKVHAKGQGQRSKVKVTGVTTQHYRFRTVTPVWIHTRWWNYAYSLMLLRRGALLFFKVICQISRSHGSKNRRIWPRLGASGL